MNKILIPSLVLYLGVAQWSSAPPSLWTGALIFSTGSSCPLGSTEAIDIVNKTIFTVSVASGNSGNTGGSDTITPSGTNSIPTFSGNSVVSSAVSGGTPSGTNSTPTFTGDALSTHTHGAGSYTAAAQVFTGSALGTHTHTYTDVVNHTHIETINSSLSGASGNGFPALLDSSTSGGPTSLWMATANPAGGVATGTTAATSAGTPTGTNGTSTISGTSSATSGGTPSGSVSTPTFTGSALGTHTHTTTATGSVTAPTFTGSQFDNRSAFVNVIACRVN